MKKIIKLNESDIRKIIQETISELHYKHKPSREEIETGKYKYKSPSEKEHIYRFYNDPDYFMKVITKDGTYLGDLLRVGPTWADKIYPGDERVKACVEELYYKAKAYFESEEYKLKRRREYERQQSRRGFGSPYTPFFDTDMGWH